MSDMHRPILPKDAEATASDCIHPGEPPKLPPAPSMFDATGWLKRFFAANPFYLASVLALLYGIFRVSSDSGFLRIETHQLLFNFTALQFYEIALVGLALMLARRRVWYDSTLLVVIENLVLIVPFILVTQASLIQQNWIWGFCAVGMGLAVARIGSLKKFLRELNFPWRVVALGGFLLLVNAVLPAVYRELQEDRVAKNPTWGAAYWMNQWSWLVILPLLVTSANLLPAVQAKGPLWPQKRGLPFLVFALWIMASGVHLYALSYVYTFQMHAVHWAPVWLVLGWTLFNRLPDVFPRLPQWTRVVILCCSFPAPFLALGSHSTRVAAALFAINAALFVWTGLRGGHRRLALQLAMASGVAILACVPIPWNLPTQAASALEFNLGEALAVYLVASSLVTRRPEMGLLGSITAAIAIAHWIPLISVALNCALQGGVIFLLLHSLLWKRDAEPTAKALLWLASGTWIIHTWLWAASGGPAGQLMLVGIAVGAIWVTVLKLRGERPPMAVMVGGAGVTLAGPTINGFTWLISAPVELVAVAASFVLLGVGTAVALTKHRWHRSMED